jgi:hypothetical protein
MNGILADNNIKGHLRVLAVILDGESWGELWESLKVSFLNFRDLSLPYEISDADLWEVCQREQLLLLTANRNARGEDSLEQTIRRANTTDSLPVLTLANPGRVLHSRDHAEKVVERLLEILIDLDNFRGVGRLFLP